MPIIVALNDTKEGIKSHKKGTQCNKSKDYAAFLVSTGNWAYMEGKKQTDQERIFFEKLEAQEAEKEDKPTRKVAKKTNKK